MSEERVIVKEFSIMLDSDRVAVVSTTGVSGRYESLDGDGRWDYVVKDYYGNEKLRVGREHVLYVQTAAVVVSGSGR